MNLFLIQTLNQSRLTNWILNKEDIATPIIQQGYERFINILWATLRVLQNDIIAL